MTEALAASFPPLSSTSWMLLKAQTLTASCLAVCLQNHLKIELYFTVIMNKSNIIDQSFTVRWRQHLDNFQDVLYQETTFCIARFIL